MKRALRDAAACRMAASQYEKSAQHFRSAGLRDTAEAHEKLATHLRSLAEDIDSILCVPGQWVCPKCGYFESKMMLNPVTGASGPSDHPALPCPNDGEFMEPLTWRQYARDLQDMLKKSLDDAARLNFLEAETQRFDPIVQLQMKRDYNRESHEWGNPVADIRLAIDAARDVR